MLGAEIVSTFDSAVQLGECKLIEEIMIGEDKVLRFSGVKRGDACTIVLRGKSKSPPLFFFLIYRGDSTMCEHHILRFLPCLFFLFLLSLICSVFRHYV